MKWYGFHCLKTFKNSIFNLKQRDNLKIKSLNFYFNSKINFDPYNFFFFVPPCWNFIIFNLNCLKSKNYLFYFYSNFYYFYLPLNLKPLDIFFFDNQLKTLQLQKTFNNNFFNVYWTNFKIIFYSFSYLFFKKMKFKGKGYYAYRGKRNTIAMQFGYSHLLRVFAYKIGLKFNTKTSIFMFGINKNDLFKITYNFKNKRPLNIFTGKGIRFTRQIVYRKTGKVSSYR